MEILNNAQIIERMKNVANLKEDKDLAEFFNVPKSTFANWKKAKAIGSDVLFTFAKKYNCSVDYLLTGESKESKLETAERMLLTAFKDLDDNQKMQAVTFVGNLASGTYSSGQGVNQTAHGNGNNQQVFSGDVGEVVGIRK